MAEFTLDIKDSGGTAIFEAKSTTMSTAATETCSSKPSKTTQDTDEEPKELMKLPIEVRVEIYKDHLLVPKDICITYQDPETWLYSKKPWCYEHTDLAQKKRGENLYPGEICDIFATSKAMFYESVPIFFGLNTFRFNCLLNMKRWLVAIGPTYRREVGSITVPFDGYAPAQAARMLARCVGLRNLTLIFEGSLIPTACGIAAHMIMKQEVMEIHGMKDLLRIRGIKTLKIEVASKPDNFSVFEAVFQVLKKPRTAAYIVRQNKRDQKDQVDDETK